MSWGFEEIAPGVQRAPIVDGEWWHPGISPPPPPVLGTDQILESMRTRLRVLGARMREMADLEEELRVVERLIEKRDREDERRQAREARRRAVERERDVALRANYGTYVERLRRFLEPA